MMKWKCAVLIMKNHNSQVDTFKVLLVGPVEMWLPELGWKSGGSKTEMK